MPELPLSAAVPASAPIASSVSLRDIASPRSRFEVYAWGAGSTAEFLLLSGVGGVMMPILTTGFHLSPVLVGWALTIPRILDTLIDPLVGYVSDRTRSRLGRRRPYLFVAAPFAALFTMALWWMSPHWPSAAQFSYLLSANLLFWTAFAFYTIPLYALGYELEDGYNERTKVAVVRSIFGSLAGFATYWIYWFALLPVFGDEVKGIRFVSVGIAALVLIFGLLPAIYCRERFAAGARPAVSFTFFASLKQAFQNRPFLYLMAIRTLITVASYLFSGLMFYVNVYFVCGGNKVLATGISGVYGMICTACGLIVPPYINRISLRYGKRRLLHWGLGLHLATAAAAYFFLTPAQPYLQIALAFLLIPAGSLMGIFTNASLPDICDLDELSHGSRREGLFGAAMAFVTKLEISACGLLVGYILFFVKFDATFELQPNAVLQQIRFFTFVPYAIATIVSLFIAQRFPITQEMMDQTQLTLRSRRASSF